MQLILIFFSFYDTCQLQFLSNKIPRFCNELLSQFAMALLDLTFSEARKSTFQKLMMCEKK